MRYTKNYKLKQPEADDYVLVEDFNENSDTVDDLIKKIESVIGSLEDSEDKDSLVKLIETLQKNKADLGKDGKVVPEQLPEVDLSGIENSITELESNALKLGETSTTAYAGDKGKIAYDHSQKAHADPNAITEEKAKELFNNEIIYVDEFDGKFGWRFVKIKNIVIATFIASGSSFKTPTSTIPVGFRPVKTIEVYLAVDDSSTKITFSAAGAISGNPITGGNVVIWEAI